MESIAEMRIGWNTARSNVDAAEERIKNLEGAIATLDAAISGGAPPSVSGSSDKDKKTKRSTGPTASEIELRFRDDLDQIRIRINQAEGERARTAEERAEFEGRQLELAEDVALRQLEADEDLTKAQKAVVRERLLALGEAERDNIAFREQAEIERRNADLADERGRALLDGLRLQFDLADTEAERRRIALQILEAEDAILRERLQQVIDSKTATDVEQERARIALQALEAQAGARRESTERQFEGPLARFARNAKDDDTAIQEAVVRRVQDINRTITDSFTNALGIKDPFLSELISIFLDKNVFGPLAEALSSQGGGGGGGFFASLAQIGVSLFGRASGGRVNAGQVYRINEGASPGRVEAFRPDVGGQIIPLGRMNAATAGGGPAPGGVVRVMIEEAPGFAATVRTEAAGVAVEVVKATAPQIVDASVNETFRRANRPGL